MSVNFTPKILTLYNKTMKVLPLAVVSALVLASCGTRTEAPALTKSGLDPQNFSAEYQGDSVALYTLTNANGMEACITNFGGRIVSLSVPDAKGDFRDVVLGFDSVQAYYPENNLSDFGAAIGRYANRINQGRFELDDSVYQLPRNNYGHCLHGGTDMGTRGWQYRVYTASQPNDSTLELTIVSPDGDNGFPGEVTATVTYTLTADNALAIAYKATTKAPTIINMTNHSYFNLSGNPKNTVLSDSLWIDADSFTPVDSTYMTLGTIEAVEGTPMDFTVMKEIGRDIEAENIQIINGYGYDHNWVLRNPGDMSSPKLRLISPESGIAMDVYTDEPGVQVYTGNFLDGTVTGKKGIVYQQRTAVCLETQHYPDTPNKPQWPTAVLRPGETYTSHCTYRFSTVK